MAISLGVPLIASADNAPPQIDALPDRTVSEQSLLQFTVVATDLDLPPQLLTYQLGAGALTGATINATSGVFQWTPSEGQGPGTNLFSVIVTDDGMPSLSATQRFTVVILEANRSPVIEAIADRTANEGELVIVSVVATDPDLPVNTLSYTLGPGAPNGATVSGVGLFTWTPSEAQGPGTNTIRVIVADNGTPSLTATQSFNIIVREVNFPPTLAVIPNQTMNEGELLTFTAVATDPDLPAQNFTFTLGGGAPAGASIDASTGVFTWTPSETQGPGSFFISVFVADDGSPSLLDARGFLVTVLEVNRPPELPPIADLTANEGTFVFFGAPPNDPDVPSQNVTVTLGPGAPAGAAISPGGFFTWSPSEAQGPSTNRIAVIATDNGTPSLTTTQFFTAIILEVNQAPTLNIIANQSVTEGELLTFTATATDPDLPAQRLTFTLGAGAPAGASIDGATGVFIWTPTEAQGPGTYSLSVVVTDDATPNQSAARGFSVTVAEANRAPVIGAIEDRVITEGSLLVFNVGATDPDLPTQSLAFTLGPGAPEGAAISSSGIFTWTPNSSQGPSTNRIAIIVADNGSPILTATQQVNITVLDLNGAPTIGVIADQSVNEGQLLTFTVSATDPDQPGQTIAFSLGGGAPAGAGIDPVTGVFTWTPDEPQGPATNTISVIVADSGTPPLSTSRSFTVVVREVNRSPVLGAIDDHAANKDTLMTFNVLASDPDIPTQALAFSLGSGAPAGAAISPAGIFTWIPTSAQTPSTNRIAIIVADNGTPSLTATQSFTAIVTDRNFAPVLAAIPDQAVDEGVLLTFTASATDADIPAQTLTFRLGAGAPDGAAINPITGVFTWTPSEGQGPATNTISVAVMDNGTPILDAARSFSVVVREVNRPPQLNPIANQSVNKHGLLVFNASASDPDFPGQTLTFSLGSGAPVGAAITAGGLFTWTPADAQGPSTNSISIIVADNGSPSLTATQQFSVIVLDVNRAPSLAAIADQTIDEGQLLTFTASATDPDQPLQNLTFSLGAGTPAGATIDPVTGVFIWTPAESQGPATNNINVVVTDSGSPALNASRGFTVVVREVNRAPEIDPIADRTVSANGFLVFSIVFRDPDLPGQPLTLSLAPGAPDGAAISPGGLFTWQTTFAQGQSSNRISVIVADSGSPSLTATQHFSVIVLGVNRAPTIDAIPDKAVNEGVLLTFTVVGRDPDQPGQTLAYALGAGAPSGASIHPVTGVFNWVPNEFQGPETNIISVIVTDSATPSLSAAGSFRVVVGEVNRAPAVVPVTNQIVNVGSRLVVEVDAADPDIPVNHITYLLGPGAPAGASITPDGHFEWRPTSGQGPSTNFITLIVADDGLPPLRGTNGFEIVVITNAPLVRPILRNPTLLTNTFTATLQAIAGRRYTLEFIDSLSVTNWQVIDALQGRGVVETMTDRNATNPNRFYRATVD